MRIHIIACRVLTRELSALIATSPNHVEVTWLPQGLHESPAVLHKELEAAIDGIYEQLERKQLKRTPDCIVLGYGLCSKAVVGITARDIPLVVPRTDDCIALFLGSEARYLDCFERYAGTYWLNDGWVENSPEIDPDHLEKLRAELMEEYDDDEDTVEYLLEMGDAFTANYKRIGYISSKVHNDPEVRQRAIDYAGRYGLDFMDFDGDDAYFKKMVAGQFDDESFLVVEPGQTVRFSDGPERIVAVEEGE